MHPDTLNSQCSSARSLGRPVIAALLAATGMTVPAYGGVNWSWLGGDGDWLTTNWMANGAPVFGAPGTFGETDGQIHIGDLPAAHGDTVTMGLWESTAFTIFAESMEISNGATLDLGGSQLHTTGVLRLEDVGSTLIVRPSSSVVSTFDMWGRLDTAPGTVIELHNGSKSYLHGGSINNGSITGLGEIQFGLNDSDGFRNEGWIIPSNNGGMTLTQIGTGWIDLDGLTGDGQIRLDTPFSVLEVNAESMNDAFSGSIYMSPGSYLNMNVGGGWSTDSNGGILVIGNGTPNAASLIGGEHFSIGGNVGIAGDQGHLRVLAPATLESTAFSFLGPSGWLEFDGPTTVEGGAYIAGEEARIDFDGPTTMRGGEFTSFAASLADGGVFFNGPTEWDGQVTLNGVARQNGDAEVSSSLGAVITADTFDMDGASGDAHWDIHSNLAVNAEALQSNGASSFTGSMDIGGGLTAKLHMNMSEGPWSHYGEMHLTGGPHFNVFRISGSALQMYGNLVLESGRAGISSDLLISAISTVDIGPASAVLRVTGDTIVQPGAEFTGLGTISNGSDTEFSLSDGVSLNQIGLINDGVFEVGFGETIFSAGAASVDRFDSTADAIWKVTLGGHLAGDEHDLLIVSGGDAFLDGVLDVLLVDPGTGMFYPSIGDEFEILLAAGSVTGSFDHDPVTQVGSATYEWSVLYHPNSVVLRLDNIVPSPASGVILGAGGLFVARRRGRSRVL